jgi:hypothetical protein
MCAKQSLKQPVSANGYRKTSRSSLTSGNTIESGYHNWRVSPRGDGRSPVRNDAGRNALGGVKVSSPVKHYVPEWPSYYVDAKAASADQTADTLGVQVHGMYRRLLQELGRSLVDGAQLGSTPMTKANDRVTRSTMQEKSDWFVVARKWSNVHRAKGSAGLGISAPPSRKYTSMYTIVGTRDAVNDPFGENQELRSPLPKLGTAGSARGLFLSLTGKE